MRQRSFSNLAMKGATALLVAMLALPAFTAGVPTPRAPATVEAPLLEALQDAPGATHQAFLTVDGQATAADAAEAARLGLTVLRVYDEFGVLFVEGTARQVLAARTLPRVLHLSANTQLEWHGDTAVVVTRAREAWDAKSTSTTPVMVNGRVVDGTGVGVAVVDTGVDATNPDLEDAVVTNLRYSNSPITFIGCNPNNDLLWVPLPNTDDMGHGTHVAGIVAGRGKGSDGRFMGAAPGASIYALGSNVGPAVFWALEALNWVNCKHDQVTPAIRVVSNSWGGPGDYNPNSAINRAVDTLVGKGIVVVFSAGNDGGEGNEDNVSTWAKNPTPGVLGVASYDDNEIASRSNGLSGFSSRGLSTDANRSHWPDIAAPGDTYTSTWGAPGAIVGPPLELNYVPHYTILSGTSMAAPHISGIVALLLQANPALTPADVEDILEDTAIQFTTPGGYVSDPSNPTTGINFGAGHGLSDAIAALRDPRVGASGGSPLPAISQNPHVYTPNLDPQYVAGVQWTVPRAVAVTVSERSLISGAPSEWPIADQQPARFSFVCDWGLSYLAQANLQLDANGGLRMNTIQTFNPPLLPGNCAVEAQIQFQGVYRAFDNFVIHVV